MLKYPIKPVSAAYSQLSQYKFLNRVVKMERAKENASLD